MCGRNETKAHSAIEMLKQGTGKDNIHFLKLDLADLNSCAEAATECLSKEHKLDIFSSMRTIYIFHYNSLTMQWVFWQPLIKLKRLLTGTN